MSFLNLRTTAWYEPLSVISSWVFEKDRKNRRHREKYLPRLTNVHAYTWKKRLSVPSSSNQNITNQNDKRSLDTNDDDKTETKANEKMRLFVSGSFLVERKNLIYLS